MKESFWGIFIIILGSIGIVAINLFQSLTVNTDHNYFLLKEVTQFAMEDSIDLSYYRSSGDPRRIRIVKESFVENLTRRFSESAVLSQDYKIVIHDIVEEPPKVSLSLLGNANALDGKDYKILLTIDSIYEGTFSNTELSKIYPGLEYIVEIVTRGPVPPKPIYEPDGKCPNSNNEIDECISGDLQFSGWEPINDLFLDCNTNINKISSIKRDAIYKKCECGKWSEDIKEEVLSRPSVDKTVVTHLWQFTKDGKDAPINNIKESISLSGKLPDCLKGLKILIVDDLTGTGNGGTLCPPQGINILSIQRISLFPRYEPIDAENRKLTWSSNSKIVSVTGQSIEPIFPSKDWAYVDGNGIEGSPKITATSTNGIDASCNVTTTTCKDVIAEVGVPANAQYKKEPIFDFNNLDFGIDDKTIALINKKGEITPLKAGITHYYITSPSFPDGKTTPIRCRLDVIEKPKTVVDCPSSKIILGKNDSSSAYLVDLKNNSFSGSSLADWTLTQTNVDASITKEGVLNSKETAYTTLYYKADLKDGYISKTGTSSLTCPFGISIDAESSGCTVGDIYATWNINSLPDLCATDISSKNQSLVNAISGSITPTFCGFNGYKDNCNNGYLTKRGSTAIYGSAVVSPTSPSDYSPGIGISTSVNTSAGTYTLTFNATFRYALWNAESLQCPVLQKTYTKTLKTSRTGKLKTTNCGTDSLTDTLKVTPEGSSEVFLGTSGVEFRAYATFSDPTKSEADIEWKATGPGFTTKTGKGGTFTVLPPSKNTKIPEGGLEVTVSAKHPNPKIILRIFRTVKIIEEINCDNYDIVQATKTCVNTSGIYKVGYQGKIAHNLNATWSSNSGIITLFAGNPTLQARLYGKQTGRFTLSYIPQVGNCKMVSRSFSVGIGTYNCTGLYPYSKSESEKDPWCYHVTPTKKPICPEYYRYDSSIGGCVKYSCAYPKVLKKDGLCYESSKVTIDSCQNGFVPISTYCYKSRALSNDCSEYNDWYNTEKYVSSCTSSTSDYYKVSCPSSYKYTATFKCCTGGSSQGCSGWKTWTSTGYGSNANTVETTCLNLKGTAPSGTTCYSTPTKSCSIEAKRISSSRSCKIYKENCVYPEVSANQSYGRFCETKTPKGEYPVCKENTTHEYDDTLKTCVATSGGVKGIFTGTYQTACSSGEPYPASNPDSCRVKVVANAKCN